MADLQKTAVDVNVLGDRVVATELDGGAQHADKANGVVAGEAHRIEATIGEGHIRAVRSDRIAQCDLIGVHVDGGDHCAVRNTKPARAGDGRSHFERLSKTRADADHIGALGEGAGDVRGLRQTSAARLQTAGEVMVTANFEHTLIVSVCGKDETARGTVDGHARNWIAVHVKCGSLNDQLPNVRHAEETISRTDGDAAVRVIHGKRGGGTQAARIEKKLVGDQAARIRPEGLLARDFHDAFIDDGLPGVAVLHAEGQSHIGATGGRGQAQGHDVAVDRFDQGAVLDAAAGHRAADIDTSDIVHGNHRVIGGVGARARVQRIHGQRAATGFHEVEGRGTVIGDHRIQIEVVARHGELEVQFTSRTGTCTEDAIAIDGVGGAGG